MGQCGVGFCCHASWRALVAVCSSAACRGGVAGQKGSDADVRSCDPPHIESCLTGPCPSKRTAGRPQLPLFGCKARSRTFELRLLLLMRAARSWRFRHFFFMQRCFLSCSPPRQAPSAALRKRLKPMLPRQLPHRPARLGRTAPLPPQRGLARPHARATSSQSAWLARRISNGECASWNAIMSVCCERSRTSGEAAIGYRSARRRQAPH